MKSYWKEHENVENESMECCNSAFTCSSSFDISNILISEVTSYSQFHQDLKSSFFTNFLMPKNYKHKLQVQKSLAKHFRTKKMLVKCERDWGPKAQLFPFQLITPLRLPPKPRRPVIRNSDESCKLIFLPIVQKPIIFVK
jgi:hypothetical protein